MKRILIYDDSRSSSEQLKGLLETILSKRYTAVDIANTREAAEKLLAENAYVLIFLDIELDGGGNGIELGAEMRRRFSGTSLVYVTAHIKYCEEIFLAAPDAFLVKPFTEEAVRRTIGIVHRRFHEPDSISIAASKNLIETIPLDNIAYIETAARSLCLYNREMRLLYKFYNIKLTDIIGKLPAYFVRCHQSICVNMKFVRRIERYRFTLENGKEIPISQSRFNDTRTSYFRYLGERL